MKKYMSHVLVGICSFLVGAGVGTLVMKNKIMDDVKNDYLDEIDSIRSEYEVRYRELIDKNNKEKADLLNASMEEKRSIVDDILDAHFNSLKNEEEEEAEGEEEMKESIEPIAHSIFALSSGEYITDIKRS